MSKGVSYDAVVEQQADESRAKSDRSIEPVGFLALSRDASQHQSIV